MSRFLLRRFGRLFVRFCRIFMVERRRNACAFHAVYNVQIRVRSETQEISITYTYHSSLGSMRFNGTRRAETACVRNIRFASSSIWRLKFDKTSPTAGFGNQWRRHVRDCRSARSISYRHDAGHALRICTKTTFAHNAQCTQWSKLYNTSFFPIERYYLKKKT